MKKSSTANEMQSRVSELEQKLSDKDNEIAQLKGDVQDLSEQVKMKQALATQASSVGTEIASRKGDTIRVNASAKQVQLALRDAGYYSGPVDGKIGAKTKKAISDFQKANNLKADGVLGQKTWSELQSRQ